MWVEDDEVVGGSKLIVPIVVHQLVACEHPRLKAPWEDHVQFALLDSAIVALLGVVDVAEVGEAVRHEESGVEEVALIESSQNTSLLVVVCRCI